MGRNTTPRTLFGRITTGMLATLLTIGSGVLLSGPASAVQAHSAMEHVEGGELTWGVNTGWRNYIVGNIAQGHIQAQEPATTVADNRVKWAEGAGEIDVAAGQGTVTYQGTMVSQGHKGYGGTGDQYALDQRLSDMQIELTSPETATLSAVVDQQAVLAFPAYDSERVELAELRFSHEQLRSGSVTAQATLTAEGADIYGRMNDNYQPGATADQVEFSVDASTSVPEPVEKKATSVSATASASTVYQDESVTITAGVTPRLEGRVQFTNARGELLAEKAVSGGKAQFTTKTLPRGDHTIEAEFTPTSTAYKTSRDAVNVAVIKRTASDNSNSSGVQGTLQWGVKESFRSYVLGSIANGKITPSGGAKQRNGNGIFTYPQASGGTSWDGSRGTVQYAGNVNFYGHDGVMDVTLSNPVIVVDGSKSAKLQIQFKGRTITLATIDVSKAKKESLAGNAVRFNSAPVTLHPQGTEFFSYNGSGFYTAGQALDRMSFTIGDARDHSKATTPASSNSDQTQSSATAASSTPAAETTNSAAAGSLKWGVSDYFAAYTTQKAGTSACPTPSKHCADGHIATSGVGNGWLFPQASGGQWDEASQTGTVNFSGVVDFKGYGMSLFHVTNPSITVHDASSATLKTGNTTSHGQASYSLDLSQGTKTENGNGSVTWSNVPVEGSLAGISASQSIGLDPLTFTVGTASTESFGANAQGSGSGEASQYEPADSPPSMSGLEILTPPEKIRDGGRIKARAEGFDAEDTEILAVLYENSDDATPIVLDDTAKADADGVVEWSGSLPDGATGDHVLTLQGSSDVGAEIEILTAQSTAATASSAEDSAGLGDRLMLAMSGMEPWEWWASAGSLLAIAGCSSLLALRHRRHHALASINA
ncbi:MAG: HtaA domain-containing protein [Micrococcaceae bacterium]|nr:HtaA domain-containing protein [Micrococcaceae bacterium]